MHLLRFFNQNWNCGIAQVEGRMVRDAIFNVNTHFVTYVVVVVFCSSVVERECCNPKIPGSNLSTTLEVYFLFVFLLSFSYHKIID